MLLLLRAETLNLSTVSSKRQIPNIDLIRQQGFRLKDNWYACRKRIWKEEMQHHISWKNVIGETINSYHIWLNENSMLCLNWAENSTCWLPIPYYKSNQALFHSLHWVPQVPDSKGWGVWWMWEICKVLSCSLPWWMGRKMEWAEGERHFPRPSLKECSSPGKHRLLIYVCSQVLSKNCLGVPLFFIASQRIINE